jgi:hypothetical protein
MAVDQRKRGQHFVSFFRSLTTAKSQASRGLTKLREVLVSENITLTEDSRIGEWTSAGA